jgi:hypothetical protein
MADRKYEVYYVKQDSPASPLKMGVFNTPKAARQHAELCFKQHDDIVDVWLHEYVVTKELVNNTTLHRRPLKEEVNMMVTTGKYVIHMRDHEGDKYIGIDGPSGGYPYWTDHFPSAKLFIDKGSAADYLTGINEGKWGTYGNHLIKAAYAAIPEVKMVVLT